MIIDSIRTFKISPSNSFNQKQLINQFKLQFTNNSIHNTDSSLPTSQLVEKKTFYKFHIPL